MNALDKIIDKINLSVSQQIEKLRADTERECAKIMEQSNLQIETHKQNLQKRINEFKQSLELKMNAEVEVFKNKQVLSTKRNLIMQVVRSAVKTLCCTDKYENRYLQYIEKVVKQNLPSGNCVLLYGRCDFERFMKRFKFQESSLIEIKKAVEFDWGVKIVCDDFEVNLSVENLFVNRLEEFENDILNVLTSGAIGL